MGRLAALQTRPDIRDEGIGGPRGKVAAPGLPDRSSTVDGLPRVNASIRWLVSKGVLRNRLWKFSFDGFPSLLVGKPGAGQQSEVYLGRSN